MILIRKAINGLAYFFLMGSVVDSKTRPRGGGEGWEKQLENVSAFLNFALQRSAGSSAEKFTLSPVSRFYYVHYGMCGI